MLTMISLFGDRLTAQSPVDQPPTSLRYSKASSCARHHPFLFAGSWWCLGNSQEFPWQRRGDGRWGLGQQLFIQQLKRNFSIFMLVSHSGACSCVHALEIRNVKHFPINASLRSPQGCMACVLTLQQDGIL